VHGTIVEATAFTQKDGRTLLPLHLDASESIFVVFKGTIDQEAQGTAQSNRPSYETIAMLDRDWTVRFLGQDAPADTVFDRLADWSKHENASIRYFSGTAVYEKSFALNDLATGKPVVLELGEVGVIATVVVNGKEAGTLWTTPWEIDIAPLVKPGKNKLSIRVANTWNNCLVGDAAKPKNQRQSYVSQAYRFQPADPLHQGGLIGPVRVKQAR
jgi:hypothetical protein